MPGFVRSKHGPEVHDVSAPPSGEDLQVLEHAVEKLEADNTGIEGDEVSALTEAELVALQVRDRNANCIFEGRRACIDEQNISFYQPLGHTLVIGHTMGIVCVVGVKKTVVTRKD